ncbi:hypothetical protein [Isoptericola sp. NPDC056605]|uniref:hypothetical protein n=1 Tax=Isoptericola sp. NPDC056605 TaxID=3345876 RepID=UPI0036AA8DAC
MTIARSFAATTAAVLVLALTACSEPAEAPAEASPAVELTCGDAPPTWIDRTEAPDFTATWETHEDCAVSGWRDGDRTNLENDVMTTLGANVVGQVVPDEEALTPIYELCATAARVPPNPPANDLDATQRLELRDQIIAMLTLCSDHPHAVTYTQQMTDLGDFS